MISERCSGPVRTRLRAGPFLWAGSGQPRPGSQQGKCCRNGNVRIMDAMTDGEMAPEKRGCLPAVALTRMHTGTASMPGRWQRWTEPLRTWRLVPWGRRSTCLISWIVRPEGICRLCGSRTWHAVVSMGLKSCIRAAPLADVRASVLESSCVCACVDGRSSSGRETQRSRLPKDRYFESECLFYLYMRR